MAGLKLPCWCCFFAADELTVLVWRCPIFFFCVCSEFCRVCEYTNC